MDTYVEFNNIYLYSSYTSDDKLDTNKSNIDFIQYDDYNDESDNDCNNTHIYSPDVCSYSNNTINTSISPSNSPSISPVVSPFISPVSSPINSPSISPVVSPFISPVSSPVSSPTYCKPLHRFNFVDVGFKPRRKQIKWPIEILNMHTKEINKYIKNNNLNQIQVKQLKQERRRLFNCMYARNSREKKKNQIKKE
jgi:hypothetical protein